MPNHFFLAFCFLITTTLNAATISGKVVTTKGEPLPYTSVLVKGTTNGTMANGDGEYLFSLPAGRYELVFQFLGYKTQTRLVVVEDKNVVENVVMEEHSISLGEARVRSGGEDPAYSIMRKAIAKSRIHNLQVESFETKTYIRTTVLLNSVPFIARKELEKEGIKVGIPLVSESMLEFSFSQPNKRFTRVVAMKSTSLDNTVSISNSFYLINFYEPIGAENVISPLSPSAFTYYNFEYLGFFEDRGVTVNKISVMPKSYGQGVWKGTIYIIEDQWNIHSAELETTVAGMNYQITQQYAPTREVWMPVNQRLVFFGKVFGFDFDVRSQVNPEYTSLKVNPKLVARVRILDEKSAGKKTDDKRNETAKSAGEILEGQKEFSLKEMNRLARLMEKEEKRMRKENKEDVRMVRQDSVVIDSLANRRTADFWDSARTIPLSHTESKGYRFTDSVRVARIEKRDSLEQDSLKKNWKKFAFGYDFRLRPATKTSSGVFLKYSPPYMPLVGLNYHTVEGLATNLGLTLQKRNKFQYPEAFQYKIAADFRYAFGMQRFTGRLETEFSKSGHSLFVGGGSYKAQFDANGGMVDYLNTITTLFGLNIAKIYLKDYGHLGYAYQKDKRLRLQTDLEYATRYPLHNLPEADLWIKNKRYTSNTPKNIELGDSHFETHKALTWSTELRWQPGLKYRLYNGRKIFMGSSLPAFTLTYRKGMDDVSYDFISLRMAQKIPTGWAGKLDYLIETGDYLSSKRLYLMDMRHLNSINLATAGMAPENIFGYYRLLNTNSPIQLSSDNYYTFSTKGRYLKAHVINEFRSLLITQIPLARLYGLKEDLFVNYLSSPVKRNYVEVGYGVDGIFKLLRLELVTSFEEGRYQRWGWQIGATF